MQAEQTQRQADERSQELALVRERQAAREAAAEQVSEKKNKNTAPALLQFLLVSVVFIGAQISNYSSLKRKNEVHAALTLREHINKRRRSVFARMKCMQLSRKSVWVSECWCRCWCW